VKSVFGHTIQLTLFGESHGPAVGCVLTGLAPGLAIDFGEIRREMARRMPGQSILASSRQEPDEWEILSGWFEGHTTGTPLTLVIRNQNPRSQDYHPHLPRPGHADLAAAYRYGGYADYRGGGHFSGRMTAPLTLAGAIAKQALAPLGIHIGARIAQIAGITDAPADAHRILEASQKAFPVWDDAVGKTMEEAILSAKAEQDSVGGVIECVALGVPPGFGDPLFAALEGSISRMMFAIPAVKGIEFGDGFGLADKRGSEANDPIAMEDGRPTHLSNHSGGITGGITNGEPIAFHVAIKPTPTIGKPQRTVDLTTGQDITTSFGGRHDPCIVPRAVPVVEAGLALCLLDLLSSAARPIKEL